MRALQGELWVGVDGTGDVLQAMPMGVDYKRVLATILKRNNSRHALKDKDVSMKTAREREVFLFSFFRDLRAKTKFREADPRDLSGRHIEAMIELWLERGLAVATVHTYLSFLRTFGDWIGKRALVRKPADYFADGSPLAHRYQVATTDRSWSAAKIDIDATIAKVAAYDEFVGWQLRLCAAFGLRSKEARHFRPHEAVRPRQEANERDAKVFHEAAEFVRIEHGTKGGRLRDIPLETDAQRRLLAELRARFAPGWFVGDPTLTALQSEKHFYYVLRRCGVTKAEMGVVAHGLRHQVINDRYEREAGQPSPVRGGANAGGPEVDVARKRASRYAGHGRAKITSAYVGGARLGRPPKQALTAELDVSVEEEAGMRNPD